MPVYLVSYTKRMLYSEQSTFLMAGKHLNIMILISFEKFKFYFEDFPRNTPFLSFGGLSNYLYLAI